MPGSPAWGSLVAGGASVAIAAQVAMMTSSFERAVRGGLNAFVAKSASGARTPRLPQKSSSG
jgi:thiazole synthase ThiGH ThiG subunit